MIKTLEQARALPEIASEHSIDVRRVLERNEGGHMQGDTVVESRPRQLSPVPLDGDSIALFSDADGRTMKVVHTVEDGWCKVELRL